MTIFSLLTAALLVTVARSAATTQTRRWSQPIQHVGNSRFAPDDAPQVLPNTNWAGAGWNKTQGTFTTVSGTFVVPTLSAPEGISGAWVGIDGFTCQTAILQTGLGLTFVNGAASYYAWYEWYPANAFNFDNITINAGDEVRLTVIANSSTTGKASIENLTRGQTVEQELNSTSPLCGSNAEWIVEDPGSVSGTLEPFNDFGTVTFKEAFALTADGEMLTPDGATIFVIEQNNQVITSVEEKQLEVTINYIGTTTQ